MIKKSSSFTSKQEVKQHSPNSIHSAKTVKDFCEEYHIGTTTFYRNLGTDKLPKTIKVGKSRRILWEDEAVWLANLKSENSQGGY